MLDSGSRMEAARVCLDQLLGLMQPALFTVTVLPLYEAQHGQMSSSFLLACSCDLFVFGNCELICDSLSIDFQYGSASRAYHRLMKID